MRASLALILLLCAAILMARMVGPTGLPADRVIKNLQARIAKNNKDANAHYLLGRAYYTLFCEKNPTNIYLYGTAEDPRFPSTHPSANRYDESKPLTDRTSIKNIQAAIKHLRTAVTLGGGEAGLYSLTLACAYEAGTFVAPKLEPGSTRAKIVAKAIAEYEKSYHASKAIDRTREFRQMPMTYENWISIEAGESILRLNPNHRLKSEIQKHLAFVRELPPGPITPLIFSLTAAKPLNELLDSSRIVAFDLDGTGAHQRYRWVKPDTAFLVWQPDASTPIMSGRQLFGSATWWLMAKDAYAALALLDDNADGWIAGRELTGLAVWRDKNLNGIAERKEVVSVMRAKIRALRTSSTGYVGESIVSAHGLRLADGRTLPTYDWVTHAIR